jgi:hypothetical protein
VVTQDQPGRFAVSYTTGTNVEGAVLSVHRLYRVPSEERARRLGLFLGGPFEDSGDGRGEGWDFMVPADGHGRRFPSREAATRWALERGYVRPYFTSPGLRARRVERAERPPSREEVRGLAREAAGAMRRAGTSLSREVDRAIADENRRAVADLRR